MRHARRRSIAIQIGVAASLVLATMAAAPSSTAAVVSYSTATQMILQEVPAADLANNTNGVCTSGATLVIKNAAGTFNAIDYLNKARACGLKVVFAFPNTINYTTGTVYPSRVAAWVRKVKNHPATFGYLSVKEPSWSRISAAEIRSLYKAYKAVDPSKPVVALFGDIPHFGTTANPYTSGMANIVMFDWYPIETTNGTNSLYLTGASKWFPRARSIVNRVTPGRPIWLMVQTHKYLRPATHKKQRPTQAQLSREVREGFVYLHASGIAFHIWRNTNYTRDQFRDPQMVSWMSALIARVKAGTFQ